MKIQFLDEEIVDNEFKTFYRSCETDLCNGWDGVDKGLDMSNPDRNGGANILAEGLENGAKAIQISIVLFISLITFLMITKDRLLT